MKLKSVIASLFLLFALIFASNMPSPFDTGDNADARVATVGRVAPSFAGGTGSAGYLLGSPISTWAFPMATDEWTGISPTNGALSDDGALSNESVLSNDGASAEDCSVSYFFTDGTNLNPLTLSGLFATGDNSNSTSGTGASGSTSETSTRASLNTLPVITGSRTGFTTLDFSIISTAAKGLPTDFTATAITPEPTSFALIGLGLAGLALLRKRVMQ